MLVDFHFSSRTKILKSVGSNQFFSTSKTLEMKKSPISRANIVHFETLALYQNVSYKMAGEERIATFGESLLLAGIANKRLHPLSLQAGSATRKCHFLGTCIKSVSRGRPEGLLVCGRHEVPDKKRGFPLTS